ncbi:type III secretion system protein SctP [Ralstonia solanacearum]|uniref:type III secretion system protein SctP n=2 Tax=Ralstonia solanacearum TaxID=305 RepID=UPI0005C62EF1|nr:type III secretion system protein SctP [Ralstonia solanacearum]MBB6593053.1 type III secretion system protein SctP [Ralstonia solanacearum]MBB6597280.1 type III secretion system protein SctP [Ralstonia solanacearum]MDB0540387.1 type III secretion system protein SctP [Ralstonia solanacearum]MDB0550368.1 type III secretion system protein SctP [Ralstonia solanacearum]MDB0555321.1 type III secretion system protein SctP [Ralstonia solanacearum]
MTQAVRLWRPQPIDPAPPARRRAPPRAPGPHDALPYAPPPRPDPPDPVPDDFPEPRQDAPPSDPPVEGRTDPGHAPPPVEPDTPLHTAAIASRLVQTCSEIGAGETMTAHLARLLSQFCASQAIRSGGECWEISLDLDPQILPETRLTLRLSSHTLSLRFEAGHPRSRHLLSEHGDTLRQRIHTLLRQQVDVELELW